jgi:hypothetical protein
MLKEFKGIIKLAGKFVPLYRFANITRMYLYIKCIYAITLDYPET